MKNVQKRSGAVGNVFLCVQKRIGTDGAPRSEPHIFHTHFKSSAKHVLSVSAHVLEELEMTLDRGTGEPAEPAVVRRPSIARCLRPLKQGRVLNRLRQPFKDDSLVLVDAVRVQLRAYKSMKLARVLLGVVMVPLKRGHQLRADIWLPRKLDEAFMRG